MELGGRNCQTEKVAKEVKIVMLFFLILKNISYQFCLLICKSKILTRIIRLKR